MTIKSEVRELVIKKAREGKGRNQIAFELKGQVSSGSISGILKKSRETSSNPAPTTIPTFQSEASVCIEQHEQSLESHASISTGININKIGSPSLKSQDLGVGLAIPTNPTSTSIHRPKPRNGGPLSHLVVEDSIEDNLKSKTNINNNKKYLNSQDETIKKEKQSQHRALLPDFKNTSRCSEDNRRGKEDQDQEDEALTDFEESRIFLESAVEEEEIEQSDKPDITLPKIDWDSSKMWERKLIRAWSERSLQLQLIKDGKRELQEEKEAIESMRETVRLEMNNLKAEKDELTEIEPQIPLARQLQTMRVDVGNFMPWNEMVRKYAISHNVDLTTAAFAIVKNLEAFGELETIRNEIKKSEAYWSALCEATRDDQRAIADLKYLRLAGCGKREFKILGQIIRGQKLDDELICKEELGTIGYRINGKKIIKQSHVNNQQLDNSLSNNGAQQPNNNNNNAISDNNGGPSMRDWIRLNMLKQN